MPQVTLEEAFADGRSARPKSRAELQATRYTSASEMGREWDSVWTRTWLFAGLNSDVPEAGDYFLYEVGQESIVVTRDDSGQIRAFYNVCQHRGNRLFTAQIGSVRQIACPYHGWRYQLDGQLCEVPDAERFDPPVDTSARSLQPVHVDCWAGMVWINMDDNPEPLESYLGNIVPRLDAYQFQKFQLVAHQTVSIAANWKTVRDNFLEQYHVDFIHPQHATLVDCCNSTNVLWPLGHSCTKVEGYTTDSRYPVPETTPPHLVQLLHGLGLNPDDFDGRVAEIRTAVQQRKRELAPELGHDYGELTDEQLSDVWQFDIFPNTFMTIQAEELWIYGPRPHPDDPNRCVFDKWTLQIPIASDLDKGLTLNPRAMSAPVDERVEHDEFDQADVIAGRKSLTITIDQDIEYLPDMQAGMRSRGFKSAQLNVDEVRVQHFHDWLQAWMTQQSG